MTNEERSKRLATLMKRAGKAAQAGREAAHDPTEELVYSMLLWNAPSVKAERALKRLKDVASDLNELRVFRPEDIEYTLGERYPLGHERAQRIGLVLNDLYRREHAVSLAPLTELNKKEARRYIHSLDAIPNSAACRVCLLSFGIHAIPVDDRIHGVLLDAGVIDETEDADRASAVLERVIKAADAVRTYNALQSLADAAPAQPRRPARTGAPAPSDAPSGGTKRTKKPKQPAGRTKRG